MPKVSITMPTYNGERYLRDALDSVLAQTFTDFELDVIVDGSTDGSMVILEEYAASDQRIRIHQNPQNIGLPASLNVGIGAARGDYWHWFSDDDLYEPDALQTLAEYLDSHPDAYAVASDYYSMDSTGRKLRLVTDQFTSYLCRLSAVHEVGKFRPEFMLVEDADFYLRLQHAYGKPDWIHEGLFRYRTHPGNLSSTKIGERQFVSARLHFDLIQQGISRQTPFGLFADRILMSGRYGCPTGAIGIARFATEKNVRGKRVLHVLAFLSASPVGWLVGRAYSSLVSRVLRRFRHPAQQVAHHPNARDKV